MIGDTFESARIPGLSVENTSHDGDGGVSASQPTNLKRKTMEKRSQVWTHFKQFIDNDKRAKAKCVHCGKIFGGDSKNGTSTLNAHLKKCKNASSIDHKQSQLILPSGQSSSLSAWSFDQEEVIEKCSLGLSKSPPQEKRMPENVMEKPVWDPKDLDQLRAVKEALHVSTAPTNVFCREGEQRRILDFCKKCVHQEKAGCLYICGCPGTGKSLSMEKVKEALVDWADKEGVESPNIISINCTSLTSTTEIFSKILEHSYPQKKPDRSTSSLQILRHLYSQKPVCMKMTLIIADELDYLITKDRAVLHDLFMLTMMPFSKCILLGVANAIDLADKFIPKLQSLNCKPTVITFRAYSKDQIKTILQQRLGELPYCVFQPQAVELCAMKVSSSSGDMRKALSVCRSAIEMFEAEKREGTSNLSLSLSERTADQQKPAPCGTTTDKTNNMVRIDHVAAALSKTFKSPVVDTIQSLPQHQQMILCSAVKLFRGGKKDTTLGELNKHYADVCKSTLIPPVGIMELSSLCRVLDDQGILKLGQSREDKLRRVALNVDEADVVFALQGVRFFRNFLQQQW